MKNDLQSRYLSNRVSRLSASKSDGIHKWRTDNLAIREIDTLEQLLRLSGHKHLGSLFNESILDLGCGDQFIGPCIKIVGVITTQSTTKTQILTSAICLS